MTHDATLSASKILVMPAWVAAFTLVVISVLSWTMCLWLRKNGYIFMANGEQLLLASIFGLASGAIAFFSAVACEIRFGTLMEVLKDRDCGWGEFRILNRTRIPSRAHGRFLNRVRLAQTSQFHG